MANLANHCAKSSVIISLWVLLKYVSANSLFRFAGGCRWVIVRGTPHNFAMDMGDIIRVHAER